MMIDITFRQLEVFVLIVEGGSFRSAAEQLSISPVSVSIHIRSLERHLGTALFERRRGATAVLTPAGQATYERATELLNGRAELVRVGTEHAGCRVDTTLRVAAHGYIAERLARPLAEFLLRHPEIGIELERRPFEGVLEGLGKSDIELGLFLSRGPVPQVPSMRAWQEELALYVGNKHPLASREIVNPAELSQYPFYYLPPRSHLRAQMNAVLAEAHIHGCPTALVSDDHLLIFESLADGNSFACLFRRGTDALVESGRLKRLKLSCSIPPLDVRYAVRGPFKRDRPVRLLADCFMASCASNPPGR